MAKVLRKIIEIDEELCDGCGLCVSACEEGAIQIIDGKAKLVSEKLCDGLGACIGECPRGAIKIIEREAEPFDHKAVEEHLKRLREKKGPEVPCSTVTELTEGALSQWPVQIRLIPPFAPFLKGAELLVCADCVPVAYPHFHSKLLAGKKVMIGCPKFDPAEEYVARFEAVLKEAAPKGITLAIMEVPCCRGLALIVEEARRRSGTNIPIVLKVISVKGEELHEEVL